MSATIHHSQSIGMTGIGNARELGGYPAADGRRVKPGVLLRTARLSTATPEDLRRLREVYRLSRIIDLRSSEEVNSVPELALFTGCTEPDPDPEIDGAVYIHLPILDMPYLIHETQEFVKTNALEPVTDIVQMLSALIESGFVGDSLYIGFLESALGRQSYSRLFRELLTLEEGRSVLFHCTQGKDRTGLAAMLILSALGISEKIIIADYMLTNRYNQKRIAAQRRMLEGTGKVPPDQIDRYLMVMDQVNETIMTNVLEHLKLKYGGTVSYIVNELGISGEEIRQLQKAFLI